MAEYGIATYDANGNYNNYGIKPVSVVGVISLSSGQTSGSYSFTIPTGTKVGFVVSNALDSGASSPGRVITASGNTITIGPASSSGYGVYPSNANEVVVFLENQ